jgi:hypothetical protein
LVYFDANPSGLLLGDNGLHLGDAIPGYMGGAHQGDAAGGKGDSVDRVGHRVSFVLNRKDSYSSFFQPDKISPEPFIIMAERIKS